MTPPDVRANDLLVIGTAGHIDHGKTSLVRALTGVDLDRLPEERARGITIALGFTHLQLPSGRVASLVDVPGHEKLVRTMIAGATGLDAVILCVSAVEGVMPQTREHVSILQLLGLERGIIALTMTDLVDEELAELAELDVEETVAGTFLEGAPILRTAAGPTPHGIDALLAEIDRLPPTATPVSQSPFRLPVDRAFVQKGFGTVVTGTVRGGDIHDGDEVEVLPGGQRTRVRGIQVHGASCATSSAGRRTALNLTGIERDDLPRGHVVCRPGELQVAQILDLHVTLLPDCPPMKTGARVRLLAGTAETLAVVTLLCRDTDHPDEDTQEEWDGHTTGLIQLRTDAPVVVLPGDRVILRRESPVTTLGGGVVLDPWAPRCRARDRAAHSHALRALQGGDVDVRLDRAGDLGLDAAGVRVRGTSPGIRLGERHLAPQRVERLEHRLLTALDAWHQQHPLADGAPRRELHGVALHHLPATLFDAVVQRLADKGDVVLDGPRIRLASFQVQFTSQQQALLNAILREVNDNGAAAPKFTDILARAPDLVSLLLSRGELLRFSDRVSTPAVMEHITGTVRDFFAHNESLSPTDFKDLFGLSRKHAIPLLEWLDDNRVTLRNGDVRTRRS